MADILTFSRITCDSPQEPLPEGYFSQICTNGHECMIARMHDMMLLSIRVDHLYRLRLELAQDSSWLHIHSSFPGHVGFIDEEQDDEEEDGEAGGEMQGEDGAANTEE